MTLRVANTVVVNNDRTFVLGTATPGSPATGLIRWNSSLTQFEVYNGSAWVAIISIGSSTPPMWAWGSSSNGALGAYTGTVSSPVSVVGGFTDWKQVSAGAAHSTALRGNGTAWAWGLGSGGRLGDGSGTTRSSPVSVVGGFTDWVQVSAGGFHSGAIRSTGTAWCWGQGTSGRLGDGTTSSRSSPVSVVGGFTDWVQINAGPGHTLALRANGTLWAWGTASSGRLGNNSTVSTSSPVSVVGGFTDWVQMSAGDAHSAAVRANGTAWCWGSGFDGRLGTNNTSTRSSPVSVVGGFTDWVQIAAGITHTAAIRANGTAWAWGAGATGRLGDGTTSTRSSPVSVVGGFTDWVQIEACRFTNGRTVAIRGNGTLWGWGHNESGQLGDGTTSSRSSPVSVLGGFTDWVQVTNGSLNVFGLRAA